MYQLSTSGVILGNMLIPNDPANADWRDYLAWVEAGNVAEAQMVPSPVPQSVSRFQARAALLGAGLLDTVQAYMDSPSASPMARLAWEDAQEFVRTSPTVAALGALLGLSDADLDNLFINAATIVA